MMEWIDIKDGIPRRIGEDEYFLVFTKEKIFRLVYISCDEHDFSKECSSSNEYCNESLYPCRIDVPDGIEMNSILQWCRIEVPNQPERLNEKNAKAYAKV